jgi:hypothetical protein
MRLMRRKRPQAVAPQPEPVRRAESGWGLAARQLPSPPPPPPAPIVMMAREFHDRPFGVVGEATVPRPVEPPLQPAQRIQIPEWTEEERRAEDERLRAEASSPEPPAPSIWEIAAANGDLGEPPPLGPLDRSYTPLARPLFPEPDWREEERKR